MLSSLVFLRWAKIFLSFLAYYELFAVVSGVRLNNLPSLRNVPDELWARPPVHPLVRHLAAIVCSGYTTPRNSQDRVYLSVLCPKPEIGGSLAGNLGGYCWWNSPRPKIFFDLRGTLDFDDGVRLRLLCLSQCYCTIDPVGSTTSALVWENLEPNGRVIDLNLVTDVRTSRLTLGSPVSPSGGRQVSSAQMGLKIGITFRTPTPSLPMGAPVPHVAPYAGRRPICVGALPPWGIPAPYNNFAYPNLQSICAVAPLGGNPLGSAGFTCLRRPDSLAETPYDLVYFDEWTPFALSNANWPGGLSLRLYCAIHCACSETTLSNRFSDSLRTTYINWLADGAWVMKSNLGLQIVTRGGMVTQLTGVGATTGPRPDWLDGKRPWWLTGLGGLEGFREKQTAETGVCGGECRSNRDCGKGGTGCRTCEVSMDSRVSDRTGVRGTDLFMGAVCAMVGLGLRGKKLGLEGSRGKRSLDDTRAVCACNATYVSIACCESEDGMLWENTKLKLGRLKQ